MRPTLAGPLAPILHATLALAFRGFALPCSATTVTGSTASSTRLSTRASPSSHCAIVPGLLRGTNTATAAGRGEGGAGGRCCSSALCPPLPVTAALNVPCGFLPVLWPLDAAAAAAAIVAGSANAGALGCLLSWSAAASLGGGASGCCSAICCSCCCWPPEHNQTQSLTVYQHILQKFLTRGRLHFLVMLLLLGPETQEPITYNSITYIYA